MRKIIISLALLLSFSVPFTACSGDAGSYEQNLENRSDDLENASNDIGDAVDELEDALENFRDALDEVEDPATKKAMRQEIEKMLKELNLDETQ